MHLTAAAAPRRELFSSALPVEARRETLTESPLNTATGVERGLTQEQSRESSFIHGVTDYARAGFTRIAACYATLGTIIGGFAVLDFVHGNVGWGITGAALAGYSMFRAWETRND